MTDKTFRFLSLGGGVQSSTLAEMIFEGELDRPDLIIFADTGDEPRRVLDQVDYLKGRAAAAGIEFAVVSNGNILDTIYSTGGFVAIPLYNQWVEKDGLRGEIFQKSMLRRQCTNQFKLRPIRRFVKSRLVELGWATRTKSGAVRIPDDVTIESWLGISLDEVQRMKKSRERREVNRWPLIEKRMSRADCLFWLESRGLPVPAKSSCRICPFHSNRYWSELRDKYPADWRHVVKVDDDLRSAGLEIAESLDGELYLHRDCIPLADVALEDNGQLELELDFCGAECFT